MIQHLLGAKEAGRYGQRRNAERTQLCGKIEGHTVDGVLDKIVEKVAAIVQPLTIGDLHNQPMPLPNQ